MERVALFPPVPPRFASRLRAAYARVAMVRSSLARHEAKVAYLTWYVDHFERDPGRFAQLHYEGHPPSSYPVQTHINRARSELQRSAGERLPHYREALPVVESEARHAESAAREQLARVRAASRREPWPDRPLSLEAYRRRQAADDEFNVKTMLKAEAQATARQAKQAASDARAMADLDALLDAGLREAERRMPAAAFAVYATMLRELRGLVDSRQLDVFALAAGDVSSLQPTLYAARRAAAMAAMDAGRPLGTGRDAPE